MFPTLQISPCTTTGSTVDDWPDNLEAVTLKIRNSIKRRTFKFLKMKYIVYKYVWENINDAEVVMSRGLNIEAFALQLSDMYEHLGKFIYIIKVFVYITT